VTAASAGAFEAATGCFEVLVSSDLPQPTRMATAKISNPPMTVDFFTR
jgi:hypothetical protein